MSGCRGPFRQQWLCICPGDHPGLAVWDPPGCRVIAAAEGGLTGLSSHFNGEKGSRDIEQQSGDREQQFSARTHLPQGVVLAHTSAGLGVRSNGLSLAVCFRVTVITQKICMFFVLSLQMTLEVCVCVSYCFYSNLQMRKHNERKVPRSLLSWKFHLACAELFLNW